MTDKIDTLGRFLLLHNLFAYSGEHWSIVASFQADSNEHANAMARRWARHHGKDVRDVKAERIAYYRQSDEFMEAFRSCSATLHEGATLSHSKEVQE